MVPCRKRGTRMTLASLAFASNAGHNAPAPHLHHDAAPPGPHDVSALLLSPSNKQRDVAGSVHSGPQPCSQSDSSCSTTLPEPLVWSSAGALPSPQLHALASSNPQLEWSHPLSAPMCGPTRPLQYSLRADATALSNGGLHSKHPEGREARTSPPHTGMPGPQLASQEWDGGGSIGRLGQSQGKQQHRALDPLGVGQMMPLGGLDMLSPQPASMWQSLFQGQSPSAELDLLQRFAALPADLASGHLEPAGSQLLGLAANSPPALGMPGPGMGMANLSAGSNGGLPLAQHAHRYQQQFDQLAPEHRMRLGMAEGKGRGVPDRWLQPNAAHSGQFNDLPYLSRLATTSGGLPAGDHP